MWTADSNIMESIKEDHWEHQTWDKLCEKVGIDG